MKVNKRFKEFISDDLSKETGLIQDFLNHLFWFFLYFLILPCAIYSVDIHLFIYSCGLLVYGFYIINFYNKIKRKHWENLRKVNEIKQIVKLYIKDFDEEVS